MKYSILKIVNKFKMNKVMFTLDSAFYNFEACVAICMYNSYTAFAHHNLGLPNNRT